MGNVAIVLSNSGKDLKVDRGNGDNVTAQQFGPAGDDAPPLKGDYSALSAAKGSGNASAVAYRDQTAENYKAKAGEKRIYARSQSGAVVAEVYLKNDGTAEIKNNSGLFVMEPSGDVVINGVRISKTGVITTPAGAEIGADFKNSSGTSLQVHAVDKTLHK